MKKIFTLGLSIMAFANSFAQHNNVEMKGLMAKEMKSFAHKMAVGNVRDRKSVV